MKQPIRPGIYCWIVRSTSWPEFIGRIVYVERRVENAPCKDPVIDRRFIQSGWVCTAAWLPPARRGWVFPSRCLRPIHGPDIDLSEPAADLLHDDLVERLTMTRAAA